MTIDVGAANLACARAFVASLAQSGLRHAIVCPGSRSTPLALALAECPGIRVWMHVDERSASFFALGIAKALREPVAILCSSGTAAANFAPAIIEANLSRVPLVALTADRPPELRDVGAAQTIDQIRLYGGAVRLFVDLPVPTGDEALLRHAELVAARAMTTARETPAGPVHVNLPFREPLLPAGLDSDDVPFSASAIGPIARGRAPADPIAGALRAIADAIAGCERGVIVCGPLDDRDLARAAATLAAASGFPILADPLSQVRCGHHDRRFVIDRYDAFLRDDAVGQSLAPNLVLRFGAMPTSKALNRFLDRFPGERHILIDDGTSWRDPIFRATDVVRAAPAPVADDLAALLADCGRAGGGSGWSASWRAVNDAAAVAIDDALSHQSQPFEGAVFPLLAGLLPDGATLFAGNSMPVRDLDSFFPAIERDIRTMANRGANGIDGVVSTALGVAAARPGPVVLVIGDLSFYHDMNGLLAAKLHALDATIVVLDNDGGGIFSFLPQANVVPPARFEQLFGTPTGLDPARVAALYDATFERPETDGALADALAAAIGRPGLNVVSIRTDRAANVRQHGAIWDTVAARLREHRLAHANA